MKIECIQELREKIANVLNATEISTKISKEDIYKFADALIANKFGRIINFAEYVGSKIAGHSNYHGDSILCALYCATEGKEISEVKPLDITECGYKVAIEERDKYKHRAEVAERALDKATELAYEYRTEADTLSCSSCPMFHIFDSCKERGLYKDCSKRWKEELLRQSKEEMQEEVKND